MSEQQIFEQEIKELEQKLEAKKREFAQSGIEQPESHIFKSVVREHVGAESGTPRLTTATTQNTATKSTSPTEIQKKAIKDLVELAFIKGLTVAVHEARKTNDAYLIDMLHDQLADEYYQKLITARAIKSS